MRPNTLAVLTKHRKNMDTKEFIRETLNAWRSKARCNIVPADKLIELFELLKFSPTEKQINEMLQTAKIFARRGTSNLDKSMNGLTSGEFCVLAADLKRFRTQNLTLHRQDTDDDINNGHTTNSLLERENDKSSSPLKTRSQVNSVETQSNSNSYSKNELKPTDSKAPEVFLGGSCNPTTWRADVAIPTLDKLGISFYNPQVSDWTPDLIELEHRAKEKARVLFFVMDSETRASAGAIEAAHIAGQNARHLVLVLHPYKPDQCILNEPISAQEFMDLRRNQQLLKELVTRRGLPVLDNIPSGLQKTKAILAGSYGRELPHNIASRLIAIRHAFDRVLDKNEVPDGKERITLLQCQCALNFLGYAQNLLFIDNLYEIIMSNREMSENGQASEEKAKTRSTSPQIKKNNLSDIQINFEEFCTLTAFLTVLHQEISESGCVSPIKGTNVHPPPIFLTNTPEWQNFGDACVTMQAKHTFRSSSSKNVPDDRGSISTTYTVITDKYRNRDSGTSSPQPNEHRTSFTISTSPSETASNSSAANSNEEDSIKVPQSDGRMKISLNVEYFASNNKKEKIIVDEDTDSNDSVFSSASSVDSILNCGTQESFDSECNGIDWDLRDIYLGGSCMLRTSWRKDVVIPILDARGISYHLPQLHESIHHDRNGVSNCTESRTLPTPLALLSGKRNKRSTGVYRHIEEGNGSTSITTTITTRKSMYNPSILESSRILLFVITNETRSLAPMTLAAHCIGLGFNVVLCVQMLSDSCIIGDDRLTPAAIKDYNRGRAYLIDLAKRQDVPVFNGVKEAVECAIEKVKMGKSRTTV